MQIQLPPTENDPIRDLVTRLKIAYAVLTAKQAVVIVDQEINVFNLKPTQVLVICSQIVGDLCPAVFEDYQQDQEIANLIATS